MYFFMGDRIFHIMNILYQTLAKAMIYPEINLGKSGSHYPLMFIDSISFQTKNFSPQTWYLLSLFLNLLGGVCVGIYFLEKCGIE